MRMAVRRLNAISTVEGDLASRTLTVAFEPAEVSLETIQRTLQTVGYESTVVE